jgi:hypothetical protein
MGRMLIDLKELHKNWIKHKPTMQTNWERLAKKGFQVF